MWRQIPVWLVNAASTSGTYLELSLRSHLDHNTSLHFSITPRTFLNPLGSSKSVHKITWNRQLCSKTPSACFSSSPSSLSPQQLRLRLRAMATGSMVPVVEWLGSLSSFLISSSSVRILLGITAVVSSLLLWLSHQECCLDKDIEQDWRICVTVEVLRSSRPVPHKVLWCLLVFLFPIGGIIVYWLFSDRASHNSGGGYEAI